MVENWKKSEFSDFKNFSKNLKNLNQLKSAVFCEIRWFLAKKSQVFSVLANFHLDFSHFQSISISVSF